MNAWLHEPRGIGGMGEWVAGSGSVKRRLFQQNYRKEFHPLTFIPVFDTINGVRNSLLSGELAERLNAAVLKTVDL